MCVRLAAGAVAALLVPASGARGADDNHASALAAILGVRHLLGFCSRVVEVVVVKLAWSIGRASSWGCDGFCLWKKMDEEEESEWDEGRTERKRRRGRRLYTLNKPGRSGRTCGR